MPMRFTPSQIHAAGLLVTSVTLSILAIFVVILVGLGLVPSSLATEVVRACALGTFLSNILIWKGVHH
jgi:hypothetical protein